MTNEQAKPATEAVETAKVPDPMQQNAAPAEKPQQK